VNAGHPPPILIGDSGLQELSVGGALLGPQPNSVYKLGFAHVDRGGALLLYTDGALEHGQTTGEAFGLERLNAWLKEWRDGPAQRALEDLMDRLRRHGGDAPFDDDVTLVYVRRPRVPA